MDTHRDGDLVAGVVDLQQRRKQAQPPLSEAEALKAELESYTEEDHARFVAETEAADRRSLDRPAGQGLFDIATAAWNNPTFPLTGFRHQTWDADSDDFTDARVQWIADGRNHEMTVRYHIIHGWTQLSLEVDGEEVADLRGHATIGEGSVRFEVTGASEFEVGPWEDHVIAVANQLRALTPTPSV